MIEEELRKNPAYQKVMDGMFKKIEAEQLENKFTNPVGKILLRPRKKTKNWLKYTEDSSDFYKDFVKKSCESTFNFLKEKNLL